MPEITNPQPSEVSAELAELRNQLSNTISSRKANNVLIATWNIRAFADLTEAWEAPKGESPVRDLHSLFCIIEIIQCFDIIAIQELKGNLKCLRDTMRIMGDDWSFLMTDVTQGDRGNNERLAFIFNNQRVKLSGLACEIVIPDEQLRNNLQPGALERQFARTPYAVGFKVKDKTFVLLTLHVYYGDNAADRVPELKAIAKWMYNWAKKLKKWRQSLIILGDFNIERKGDAAYEAFVNTRNLFIPEDLIALRKTIFNVKHYDQIGWYKNSRNNPQITLKYIKGGIFDFIGHVLKSRDYTLNQLSYRISDHFPLWAEFEV